MLALLMATHIATAGAPAIAVDKPLISRNGLNFIPSACRAGVTVAAGPSAAALLRPQDRGAAKIERLGDLPKAHWEIAINRTVSGCAAPLIVSYEVQGDGRFAAGSGN
ncbi:hypothetical protein [Phenylobacterium sp.]|uniref:hypothetical protein n=1 Tax=Phenylobacterium sp. TaxID=1871053 RepID=UPI002DE3120F|nr:hypothetical protein [Phenylobacterium sp.]